MTVLCVASNYGEYGFPKNLCAFLYIPGWAWYTPGPFLCINVGCYNTTNKHIIDIWVT